MTSSDSLQASYGLVAIARATQVSGAGQSSMITISLIMVLSVNSVYETVVFTCHTFALMSVCNPILRINNRIWRVIATSSSRLLPLWIQRCTRSLLVCLRAKSVYRILPLVCVPTHIYLHVVADGFVFASSAAAASGLLFFLVPPKQV